MRYTAVEIEKIRQEAKNAGLRAPALFWDTPAEYLRNVCNGCGAEDSPAWARNILSWIYRHYTPVHAIHDCDFEESDGTDAGRDAANIRFCENALILWRKRFGALRWLRPSSLWDRNKIRLSYKALRLWSGPAWLAAYSRNMAREVSE